MIADCSWCARGAVQCYSRPQRLSFSKDRALAPLSAAFGLSSVEDERICGYCAAAICRRVPGLSAFSTGASVHYEFDALLKRVLAVPVPAVTLEIACCEIILARLQQAISYANFHERENEHGSYADHQLARAETQHSPGPRSIAGGNDDGRSGARPRLNGKAGARPAQDGVFGDGSRGRDRGAAVVGGSHQARPRHGGAADQSSGYSRHVVLCGRFSMGAPT